MFRFSSVQFSSVQFSSVQFSEMRVVAAVLVLGFLGLAGESVAQTTGLVRTAYLPPVGCSNSGCPTAVFEYDPDGRALRSTPPGRPLI